jgi:hypothetical protein
MAQIANVDVNLQLVLRLDLNIRGIRRRKFGEGRPQNPNSQGQTFSTNLLPASGYFEAPYWRGLA